MIEQSGFVPTLGAQLRANGSAVCAASISSDSLRKTRYASCARAAASGHKTAVALVASNERGYRLRNSFRAEFEATVAAFELSGYEPNAQDVSGAIPTSSISPAASSAIGGSKQISVSNRVRTASAPGRRHDLSPRIRTWDGCSRRSLRFLCRRHSDLRDFRDLRPGNRARTPISTASYSRIRRLCSPDSRSAALTRAPGPLAAAGDQVRLYGLGFDAYQLVAALYEANVRAGRCTECREISRCARRKDQRDLPLAQFRNGRPGRAEGGIAGIARELANESVSRGMPPRRAAGSCCRELARAARFSCSRAATAAGSESSISWAATDETFVVVEVRARRKNAFDRSCSIDHLKRARIIQATRHLLMRHAEW